MAFSSFADMSRRIPDVGRSSERLGNLTVRLSGTSIKIGVNGTQVLDETVPDLVGATKHGMYAFSGTVGAWHGIEFTP